MVLVAQRRGRNSDEDQARPGGRQARITGGGELRAGSRGAAGEESLEQVAADALAVRLQQALGLEVDLGGLARGDVHVAHDDRRQLERQLACVGLGGGEQHRLPEDLGEHAERVHEVGERHPTRRVALGLTKSISRRVSGRPSSSERTSASCSWATWAQTSAWKAGSAISP